MLVYNISQELEDFYYCTCGVSWDNSDSDNTVSCFQVTCSSQNWNAKRQKITWLESPNSYI